MTTVKKLLIGATLFAAICAYAVYQRYGEHRITPPIISQNQPGQNISYKDGTYTGNAVDAYYGNVQVQAIVSGGKLANVTFLQYPNDRPTSKSISSQSMPYLQQEAIASQSAQVNVISGATDTSQAFAQSLASALSQARN